MLKLRLGVAAAGFTTFVNLYPTQALLPTLARAFGTDLAHTGLTVTAALVAVALVAPFVGGVSDVFGRRRLILGAAVMLVVPTLLVAAAPSFGVLLAARFMQGLLLPFIFAVTVAYIAEECPGAEAVQATSWYAVGTIVGGFGGRFVAGWAAALFEWRAAFVVLAGLTLMGAAVVAACLPREQRFRAIKDWRGSVAGFGDQFGNPQVMVTCAVGFAVLFSIVATFTFINFVLAGAPYSLGTGALGSIFVVYLAGAAATPAAGKLAGRFGRRPMMAVGGGAVAAGLLLTLAPSLALIVLGMALVAIGVFTEQVLSISYVAAAARRARSTAVGLYVTCYYVGGALGGVAPAWVWSHFGWPGCVALVLAVQAAAMALALAVWPGRMGLP